jgi:uncharacterized membrane protein YgdD (TMEM256/DUF423 family)
MTSRAIWLALAALSGGLSVAIGAFATHGVADPMVKELLKTGASYEMTHALAVFAAICVLQLGGRRARFAPLLFLLGTLAFSGSLYALALGAPHIVGAITPVGGVMFLSGWAVLALGALGVRTSLGEG